MYACRSVGVCVCTRVVPWVLGVGLKCAVLMLVRVALDATIQASRYTHQAIATAPQLGKGHGPLNHGHSLVARIVPQ